MHRNRMPESATLRLRRMKLGALVSCAVLSFSACEKTATDDDADKHPRFTGTGAWSVNNIKVGQTYTELEADRGKPNPSYEGIPASVSVWPDSVTAVFDASKRVLTVYGTALYIGAIRVAAVGLSAEQTQQILGEGKKKVFRGPKGSGVISTGYVVTGTTLTYERDGVYFSFIFSKDNRLTAVNTSTRNPDPR